MRRTLLLAFALGLPTASSQTRPPTPTTPTLELTQPEPALAGHPVRLRLTIAHRGPGTQVIGGLFPNEVPCPLVKVYDKAGGPPLIERYVLANCLFGWNVTFKPGERRTYGVTLPMLLTPGEYTVVLTLRSQPPLHSTATVRVGPGPFVTQLVLPTGARAGKALDLRVASVNVWRSAVSADLRLCGQGLLIRDEQSRTVYDNRPEQVACTADLRPTRVAPGSRHVEPWGTLPALKAGWYTAILWSGISGAATRFEVRP